MNSKCSGKLSCQRNQVIPEKGEKKFGDKGEVNFYFLVNVFFSGCI